MNRDQARTISSLELLIWAVVSDVQAPYLVDLLHIVCVQLANLIGSRSGIQAEQRYPLAVWLLLLRPLDQPLFLRRCVPAARIDFLDPL
ncbi:hypothetical protein D3C85_1268200 [compost metagenome]